MSKIALVTGGSGFVGTHLIEYLESKDWEVYYFDKAYGDDITDYESVRNELDQARPDAIFHLAAQAYVAESFTSPQRAIQVNTIGSLNILEAVRQLGLKTTVHLAGTSEEYGDGDVDEESKLQPKSPYAISKVAMDHLGQLYAKAYGMHVIVTRAFNHTGPGRGEQYAESSFAKQIVEIELGKRKILEHGNLSTIRNYTDVRDTVRAYELSVGLPSGVYNICSNQNITIHDVLDKLMELSSEVIPTSANQALLRPADFSFEAPSHEKFTKLTGWEPEIKLDQTLEDILNYWRERLK